MKKESGLIETDLATVAKSGADVSGWEAIAKTYCLILATERQKHLD